MCSAGRRVGDHRGRQVAGFGGSHTVWGELADDASMALAETLVNLPVRTDLKPGEMRLLQEHVRFTLQASTV